MIAFGWLVGGLAVFYAGMVVLGAWMAHELRKRREEYLL